MRYICILERRHKRYRLYPCHWFIPLYLFSIAYSDSMEKMDSTRSLERVDFDELLLELQDYVSKNRIRVCEHFQDFDHLRSGCISMARFRQVQLMQ